MRYITVYLRYTFYVAADELPGLHVDYRFTISFSFTGSSGYDTHTYRLITTVTAVYLPFVVCFACCRYTVRHTPTFHAPFCGFCSGATHVVTTRLDIHFVSHWVWFPVRLRLRTLYRSPFRTATTGRTLARCHTFTFTRVVPPDVPVLRLIPHLIYTNRYYRITDLTGPFCCPYDQYVIPYVYGIAVLTPVATTLR